MQQDQQRLRIALGNRSRCCCKPMFIGRYAHNGTVKACCERCGRLFPIDQFAFSEAVSKLKVPCAECGEAMQPTSNVDGLGSYGFSCECEARKLLSDLVPQISRALGTGPPGTDTSAGNTPYFGKAEMR